MFLSSLPTHNFIKMKNRLARGAARLAAKLIAAKGASSNNTEPKADQIHTSPDSHNTESKFTESSSNRYVVRIAEEVIVKFPPNFLAQYRTDQDANDAHNKKTRLVSWLTFGAVFTYTFVTVLLWKVSNDQAKASIEANRLLEEQTRGRLSFLMKLKPIQAGEPIQVNFTIKNVGHAFIQYKPHYGDDTRVSLPDGDIPLRPQNPSVPSILVEAGDEVTDSTRSPQYITAKAMAAIPSMKEMLTSPSPDVGSIVPSSPVYYLYGRFDYVTLGHPHKNVFCAFVAKNTPAMDASESVKSEEFVLLLCPKWNYVE